MNSDLMIPLIIIGLFILCLIGFKYDNFKWIQQLKTIANKFHLNFTSKKSLGLDKYPLITGIVDGRKTVLNYRFEYRRKSNQIVSFWNIKVSNQDQLEFTLLKYNRFKSVREKEMMESNAIGDEEFDNNVFIKTNQTEKLKQLLTEDIRPTIQRIVNQPYSTFTLEGNELKYNQYGRIWRDKTRTDFEESLNILRKLARNL